MPEREALNGTNKDIACQIVCHLPIIEAMCQIAKNRLDMCPIQRRKRLTVSPLRLCDQSLFFHAIQRSVSMLNRQAALVI
jgi:hypothetical protein